MRARAIMLVAIAACGRGGFDARRDRDGCVSCDDASGADTPLASAVLDLFQTVSYDGNDGTVSWSTPWIEAGDDGSPVIATGSHIFVENHVQNPTANTPALKIKVDASGPSVFREANLAGATAATLSYRFHNELLAPGVVEVQVSGDGGATWTALRTYAEADVFGSETFPITQYAAVNTQIRLVAIAVGGRHVRIDDVGITFDRP
jgi:hypothetical protein